MYAVYFRSYYDILGGLETPYDWHLCKSYLLNFSRSPEYPPLLGGMVEHGYPIF